jgi:hypothetical protein
VASTPMICALKSAAAKHANSQARVCMSIALDVSAVVML